MANTKYFLVDFHSTPKPVVCNGLSNDFCHLTDESITRAGLASDMRPQCALHRDRCPLGSESRSTLA